MHARKDFFWSTDWLFLVAEKARKRELRGYCCTFDENRRTVGMLNPMCDENEVTYRGGEGATPVTTACPEEARPLRVIKLLPWYE